MDNTLNPTADSPTLKAALFKSLAISVDDTPPPANLPSGAPMPDSGLNVEKPVADIDPHSTLADVVRAMKPETPPLADPVVIPTPAATPPVAVVPPVAPVEPPKPVVKSLEIPELPQRPIPAVSSTVPSTLDVSGLDDDEINEIRTAEFAEGKYPTRYAGHAKRVLDFIREHKQFVQQAETRGPLEADDPEYVKFVQAKRPRVTDSERKRLERERLLEDAAVEAEKRSGDRVKKLEEEVTLLKAAPLVEKTINDYKSLIKEVMPKAEDDPLLTQETTKFSTLAENAGREFLMLSSRLKDYDSRNETHRWLSDFIETQGELYVKSKHESLKRGSKSFVKRADFNRLPADDRSKHFTFTDEDVLQLIAVNAKAAAEYNATQERERIERAGYVRKPANPPATPASPPPVIEPEAVPRARSSVATPVPAPSHRDAFSKMMFT